MATAAKKESKPNAGFMKPVTPSKILAEVVGAEPMPRTEVTKKVWDYIKKHDLQDAANRRLINADAKLEAAAGVTGRRLLRRGQDWPQPQPAHADGLPMLYPVTPDGRYFVVRG